MPFNHKDSVTDVLMKLTKSPSAANKVANLTKCGDITASKPQGKKDIQASKEKVKPNNDTDQTSRKLFQ